MDLYGTATFSPAPTKAEKLGLVIASANTVALSGWHIPNTTRAHKNQIRTLSLRVVHLRVWQQTCQAEVMYMPKVGEEERLSRLKAAGEKAQKALAALRR